MSALACFVNPQQSLHLHALTHLLYLRFRSSPLSTKAQKMATAVTRTRAMHGGAQAATVPARHAMHTAQRGLQLAGYAVSAAWRWWAR
jgi:hypothetical protein